MNTPPVNKNSVEISKRDTHVKNDQLSPIIVKSEGHLTELG